jgi:hypothetical protein
VSASEKQLQAAPFVAKGITHLALQFWVPTQTGQAVLDSSDEASATAVASLRDWGHQNGIRVMLCVYNGAKDWDWPLAKAGFAANPDTFVDSLVSQVQQFDLDGVDIDLEGPAQYEGDKPAYVSFIQKLSGKLHRLHKQLTLDSFCYTWNAPNEGWWPDLFPMVDAITSMGYEEIGLGAKDWASYAAQQQTAGQYAAKLQIGVPGGRDKWLGNTSVEQLGWIRTSGQSGVGIWDARLRGSSWKTDAVWSILDGIRTAK